MAVSDAEKYAAQLPTDEASARSMLSQKGAVQTVRQMCEEIERQTSSKKCSTWQANAYKFQMIVYLIQNELDYAKFLWKRLPPFCKDPEYATMIEDESKAKVLLQFAPYARELLGIWKIGIAMYKEEYSNVYVLAASVDLSPVLKPFLEVLITKHRERMIALVTKAYTSITLKELQAEYTGADSSPESILAFNKDWSYDGTTALFTIDRAPPAKSLDATLLRELTDYVGFLEAQHELTIDTMSAAVAPSGGGGSGGGGSGGGRGGK